MLQYSSEKHIETDQRADRKKSMSFKHNSRSGRNDNRDENSRSPISMDKKLPLTKDELLFFAILFIHLIPIWSFTYFPSQDGPVHLSNVTILKKLLTDSHTIYHEFFNINSDTLSNWLFYLILAAIISFVPALTAEKIILTAYILLLPISVRYAVNSINPKNRFVSFLILPFIYNYTFHMGFYSFIFSLSGFFFLIGFWFKHREKPTFSSTFILALIALTTYLFHIVSFFMAGFTIGLILIIEIIRTLKKQTIPISNSLTTCSKDILSVTIAFSPSLLCTMIFLSNNGIGMGSFEHATGRLHNFLMLGTLHSFNTYELYFTSLLFFLFCTICFFVFDQKYRNKLYDNSDSLAIVSFCSIILYFFVPDKLSGGSALILRLLLYPFFIMILWLGAQHIHKSLKRYIILSTIIFSLSLICIHAWNYSILNTYIKKYLSTIHHIESNTTILPISFNRKRGSLRVATFEHAASYITTQKEVVELKNHQASKKYFPIKYKPELDPFAHLSVNGGLNKIPPKIDMQKYSMRTTKKIDYVLVWDYSKKFSNNTTAKKIFSNLDQNYNLIYQENNVPMVRLYQRKKSR